MPARERASETELRKELEARDGELERLRRESLRVEELRERLARRDQEIEEIRAQSQTALRAAENELEKAAARIAELSRSRPPDPEDPRARLKKVEAELGALRKEHAELIVEADGLKAASQALQAAAASRETRVAEAAASAKAATERANAADDDAKDARALATGAQMRFEDLRAELEETKKHLAQVRGDLDVAREESAGLRPELDKSLAAETKLRVEHGKLVAEHNELKAKEAGLREDLLAERARETQLLDAAKTREADHEQDAKSAHEQIAALTRLIAENRDREVRLMQQFNALREREAAVDAELRLSRGQEAQARGDLHDQLDLSRIDVRKLRAELDESRERAGLAEARVGELQSVVDSLGRERLALRADAGALRAKAELLGAAEERNRRLSIELEELRGENEFLNQEMARIGATEKAS
jgi:chromosome segregation ATPase